jgi:hypothetical protein
MQQYSILFPPLQCRDFGIYPAFIRIHHCESQERHRTYESNGSHADLRGKESTSEYGDTCTDKVTEDGTDSDHGDVL